MQCWMERANQVQRVFPLATLVEVDSSWNVIRLAVVRTRRTSFLARYILRSTNVGFLASIRTAVVVVCC